MKTTEYVMHLQTLLDEACKKLDKIEYIVRFETGNRWEIEDKILEVIRGEEK